MTPDLLLEAWIRNSSRSHKLSWIKWSQKSWPKCSSFLVVRNPIKKAVIKKSWVTKYNNKKRFQEIWLASQTNWRSNKPWQKWAWSTASSRTSLKEMLLRKHQIHRRQFHPKAAPAMTEKSINLKTHKSHLPWKKRKMTWSKASSSSTFHWRFHKKKSTLLASELATAAHQVPTKKKWKLHQSCLLRTKSPSARLKI